MIKVYGNKLEYGGKTYNCAIGKNGFSIHKKEGDNCTPVGKYLLREVLYRNDKIAKPETHLPISIIQKIDGWCDASEDVNYNKKVKLPYPVSHEKLWRDDDLYDLIIPIGYNDNPVFAGKGSAIFIHVARPGYEGTEGCVALKIEDLLQLIKYADIKTMIDIHDRK